MGGSDEEGSLKKEKKEKKDKDKDKEKKDKGKDKDKDEKKEKKDKDGGEKKDKKDKDGGERKDKDKKEKDKKDKGKDDKDKGKDDKGKDKEKDKDKKEKKDKKDKKDEDEDEDGEDGKKKKKDKDKDKAKDKDKDKKDKSSQPSGINVPSGPVLGGEAASYYNPSGAPPQSHPQPGQPPQSGEVPWFLREPGAEVHGQPPPRAVEPGFPNPNPQYTTFQQPPPQQISRTVSGGGGVQPPQNVPPSGYRIPLDPNSPFPTPDQLGRPPATDFNSSTGPIFIGSAIFPDSVHPCKIVPSLHPACRVSYGGSEVEHHGRYDLLPITLDMEWVPAVNGQNPPGRRPVEGGYESNGGKLYHALGSIQGVQVPGKAGERLRGASIPYGGSEHYLQENYSVLCWK